MLIGHAIADANGVILDADRAVCDFLERSRRELVGASYVELTHPADRMRNALEIDRLRPNERPATVRKRYVLPDGSSVWTDVAISRLETGIDAGRLLGTINLATEPNVRPARLWRAAVDLARLDQVRRSVLGSELFGDHCWAILVHIYLAEAEGRGIDATGLGVATGMSTPSVDRWLAVLEGRDLVEPRLRDGGRQLTAEGIARLEKVLLSYQAGRLPDAKSQRAPEA